MSEQYTPDWYGDDAQIELLKKGDEND